MRHGQATTADTDLLDTQTVLGLTMTIEDWMELNPCTCEAGCECEGM